MSSGNCQIYLTFPGIDVIAININEEPNLDYVSCVGYHQIVKLLVAFLEIDAKDIKAKLSLKLSISVLAEN